MSEEVVTSTPPAESSAPATPPATQAAPAPPVATAPAPPAQATQSTPPSAPEGWVPSYRIRETREAALRESRAEIEREKAAARAEVERYRAQVLALTGVQPQNQNPEVAAIKQQFGQLYPGLNKLEQKADQLDRLFERAQALEEQNNHYWATYARQSTTRLYDQVEKAVGSPLTEEGKNLVHASFVGFLQSSPELERRYESDPTIVDEFAKAFTSQFVDPARRATASTVATRAAAVAGLPQDAPSGAPRSTPAPKLGDTDERAAAAWLRYQQLAKP